MPRKARLRAVTVRRAEPGDYAEICRTFEGRSAYPGTLQLPYERAIARYREHGFEVDTYSMARVRFKK